MRDLLMPLPADMRPRVGLEYALRDAIRTGRLVAGATLPSTRSLAEDLGVGRSTVVAAYEQLAVEGYVVASHGRSTTVAAIAVPTEPTQDRNPLGERFAHDFRPGEPSLGSFPRRDWQRSLRHTVLDAPDEIFGYGDPRGRAELREVLAQYLARSRSVHVDATAVRIYAGFASSLGFIGELFRHRGIRRIAVEQPMLRFHRQILELVGVETVQVRVDDQGLVVEDLQATGAQVVLTTPGNQQPLGVTMSSERRSDLVAWAAQCDGWIVEDDYDGEFRYDRRPIGALQGLDADRVLYAGTASKSMAPGLNLSWLVVPRALRRDLAMVTQMRAGVSTINQLALADFIDRGAYDRHVRQRRRVYRHRRVEVADQLSDLDWLTVGAGEAGMHLVANITDRSVNEGRVISRAAEESVGLIGLQTHFEHHEPGLIINVSRPADHQFAASTIALRKVLGAAHRDVLVAAPNESS